MLAVIGMAAAVLAVLAVSMTQRAEQQVAPQWLDDYLDAAPEGTQVLNDWDTGAYFLWRHPQLELAMHGYVDVFTDAELERNSAIIDLRPGWDDRVEALDADLALLAPSSPLAYALEDDGWTRIDGDEQFILLSPPATLTRARRHPALESGPRRARVDRLGRLRDPGRQRRPARRRPVSRRPRARHPR